MDIKTHAGSFDVIQESDRAGWIDKTIRKPEAIREAPKELKEAADHKAASSDENAENYATEQFTGKTLQLESVAGTGIRNLSDDSITKLTEIRERRKDRTKAAKSQSDIEEEPAEKRKEKSENGKSGNSGIKVKEKNSKSENLKIKEKGADLKEGKDIKTGKMEIRTSADINSDSGEPAPAELTENLNMSDMFSYRGKTVAGKKGGDYTQIVTEALKKLVKVVISSLVVYILPVIVVFIIILMVLLNYDNSLNKMGNQVAKLFDEEYEENSGNKINELKISLSANSVIIKANKSYHKAVQEVIDQRAGEYDVIVYEDIEPDWKLITEVYISMAYINNGESDSGIEYDAEEFEELMWNMVSIEQELQPDVEGEDEIKTETPDETEAAPEQQLTLTVYAKMSSLEDVAELYDIDLYELKNVVSMADVYGSTIDEVISNLETFNPE